MPSPTQILVATLIVVLLAGCSQDSEIRTYEAPKEATAGQKPAVGVPSRMMAAMLEGEDQVWFFKLMGAQADVDAVAQQVRDFLDTVEYEAQQQRPTWNTPEAWEELPQSGMRLATLRIPHDDTALELTVIGLPRVGDWDSQVLDNVNRWRGQLGLSPISEKQAADLPSRSVGGRTLVVVTLAGQADGSASMMGGRSPFAAGGAAPPAAPAITGGPLDYELPDNWRELPPNSMRLVNLSVGDESTPAEVTVFAFSAAAPAMADPLANINRWRQELGMPPTSQEELDQQTEELEIGGLTATYVDLRPEGGQERTLAAMAKRGDRVWFFKLRGPAKTVDAQRDVFRRWLTTINFRD